MDSDCDQSNFGKRYKIILHESFSKNGEMNVHGNCDVITSFTMPLSEIDHKDVYLYVVWKFTGDKHQYVELSAELQLNENNEIHFVNWGFK